MKKFFCICIITCNSLASFSQGSAAERKFRRAMDKDDYAQAKELIPQILSEGTRHLEGKPEEYASLMNLIGLLLSNYGEDQKSITYFNLALEKACNELGDTSYTCGLYAYNSAIAYKTIGKYEEAEPLFLKSLPLLAKQYEPFSADYTHCYYQLALLYIEMGRYAEAEPMLNAIIYFFEISFGKDNDDYRSSQGNLARVYEGMGQYKKAENIFLESLEYYRRNSPVKNDILSVMLNNLAELYWKMGRYESAEKLFLESLEIRAGIKPSDPIDSASTLNNLGLVYKAMSDFTHAENAYLHSIAIYKRNGMEKHPDYTNPVNNLGELYRLMGRHEQAFEKFTEVIELREQLYGTQHPNYANAVNNLGLVYFGLGYYVEAEKLLLLSKDIYRATLGENHDYYANCLNNLAILYRIVKRFDEAEYFYNECLRISKAALGTDHKNYALYLNGAGILYKDMGNYEKAASMIREASQIMEAKLGKGNYDYIDMIYNLAEVYREMNLTTLSKPIYLEAMQGYLQLISDYFPGLSEDEKTAFYYTVSNRFDTFNSYVVQQLLENPGPQNNDLIEAMFNIQLQVKSLLLSEITNIKARVMAGGDSALADLFSRWENSKTLLAKALQLSQEDLIIKGIDAKSIKDETNTLEKELSLKLNGFSSILKLKSIKWQDVAAKLDDHEALVEIIRVDYYDKTWKDTVYYVALSVNNASIIPGVAVLKNGKDLELSIFDNYRKSIWESREDMESYNEYWAPLKTITGKAKKVYFTPDGCYHKINLYTLKNPESGNYLINDISIILQTNAKDLLISKVAKPQLNSLIEIFAYPEYYLINDSVSDISNANNVRGLQQYGYNYLQELPGTLVEAEKISAIFTQNNWSANAHLGPAANESALKAIKSPGVLHIATHGYFNMDSGRELSTGENNPLFRSGLMLAGAGSVSGQINRGEDGILSAFEVLQLNLENTELVALSACETALGEVRNGQGVYGLQRAFMAAGAKALIMSLWQVEDNATQELMNYFYHYWLNHKSVGKQEAFRIAQQEIMKKYQSPVYWGAFVILGE